MLIASCVEKLREVEGGKWWMPCGIDSVGDDFRFGRGSEMAAQADFGGDGWICEIEQALLGLVFGGEPDPSFCLVRLKVVRSGTVTGFAANGLVGWCLEVFFDAFG